MGVFEGAQVLRSSRIRGTDLRRLDGKVRFTQTTAAKEFIVYPKSKKRNTQSAPIYSKIRGRNGWCNRDLHARARRGRQTTGKENSQAGAASPEIRGLFFFGKYRAIVNTLDRIQMRQKQDNVAPLAMAQQEGGERE